MSANIGTQDDYKSTLKSKKDTPMYKRLHHPATPQPLYMTELYENKGQDASFIQGFLDDDGYPLDSDDYYGIMGAMGYYDNRHLPRYQPLAHDANTTTAIHFTDTSYQKTPIDIREETEPNLSRTALDFKEANLYNIQDFSETSARRIIEKTHRIHTDPDRKLQSQMLIDIQQEKAKLLDPALKMHPLTKLLSYNEMILKVNTITLNRITDVLDYLEKQYTFSKYELRPLGYTFYCEMTLKTGAQATHFDFTDDTKNVNIPPGTVMFRYPRHNLLSLQIIFDSGTDVYYSTNEPGNSLDAFVRLTSVVLPNAATIRPGQQVISSLNIRAGSPADSKVRLVGLF